MQTKLKEQNARLRQEITERKLAEEELLESERRYRTLFNSTGDAIFVHDLHGRFLDVNQVACERLGYSREELLQMHVKDMSIPKDVAGTPGRMKKLQQEGGHIVFEATQIKRNGVLIPTEINSRYVEYGNQPVILAVACDITERKRADIALQESEEKMRSLARLSHKLEQVRTYAEITLPLQQEIQTILGYRSAWIYLVDEDREHTRLLSISGEA
ncbi:MAG: PAS domain S-box protein, partial [Chloroflexi bacterium]|nr:PAS domain S-box protein [Chloroflexota bacterium]